LGRDPCRRIQKREKNKREEEGKKIGREKVHQIPDTPGWGAESKKDMKVFVNPHFPRKKLAGRGSF